MPQPPPVLEWGHNDSHPIFNFTKRYVKNVDFFYKMVLVECGLNREKETHLH